MKKLLTICFACLIAAVGSAFGQSAGKAFDDLIKQLDKNPDNLLSCVENRDSETKKLETMKSVYVLNTDAEVAQVKSAIQKTRSESTRYTVEKGAIVSKMESKDREMSIALVTDLNSMRALESSFLTARLSEKPKAIVIVKVEYDD